MRRVKGGVQLMADLTSVAEFIGAGEAMAETVNNQEYMDEIIKAAHGLVEDEFNVEVAAAAAAGDQLRHMFEWGTQGINRGKSDMRPNPLSDTARLWVTTLSGHGSNQTLTYAFRPSFAMVPKPTTAETGMDQEDIRMLEDHVFTSKAMVFETGSPVTIRPQNANFLIIPYYESQRGSTMFSDADKERGFTLSKGPHTFSPGEAAGSVGRFTAFWSSTLR